MSRIRLPRVFDYYKASEYFSALNDLNKSNKSFSQRFLARELGWPVSYIPDIIKGRKPLTVIRAMQFSKRFRMDALTAERIVMMAVASQNPEVALELGSAIRANKAKRKTETTDLDLLDARLTILFEAIRFLRGQATEELLVRLLVRQEFSREEVKRLTKRMLQKEYIARKGSQLHAIGSLANTDDIDSQYDDQFHAEMAEQLKKYFGRKIGPAMYHSGILHIDVSRYHEIIDRMTLLRDWLIEISAIDSVKEEHNTRLFQMELNLVPLFDRKILVEAGVGNFAAATKIFPKYSAT